MSKVTFVKGSEMAEIEKTAWEEYGISSSVMMEFAGYFTAKFIHAAKAKNVLFACGTGNNGGDGICAARHLSNFGVKPKVFLIEGQLKEESKKQLELLNKAGVKEFRGVNEFRSEAEKADLVVDALLGYKLKGNAEGEYAKAIEIINSTTCAALSIDVPSGFDSESGEQTLPCVKADEVICLGLPKFGLEKFEWGIYVAYTGLPKETMQKYLPGMNLSGLKLIK